MKALMMLSSPRPWGCFLALFEADLLYNVFPTPVGVFPPRPTPGTFPLRLPHARGGVSSMISDKRFLTRSSPRPWGCFSQCYTIRASCDVFPTPVGVFRYSVYREPYKARLPHARGGVSGIRWRVADAKASSPRPWGCFHIQLRTGKSIDVFPTPVGVFPLPTSRR